MSGILWPAVGLEIVRTRSGHMPKGPPSLRPEALYRRSTTAFSHYTHFPSKIFRQSPASHVSAGSRSGTYDGQSGTAYLVAKLILFTRWRHSRAGAHMKIGPAGAGVQSQWEEIKEKRGKGIWLMCRADFLVEVRIPQPSMKVPSS